MDAEAEEQSSKAEMESNKNENLEPRGQWSGRLDFIVSCLGYAVGKTQYVSVC